MPINTGVTSAVIEQIGAYTIAPKQKQETDNSYVTMSGKLPGLPISEGHKDTEFGARNQMMIGDDSPKGGGETIKNKGLEVHHFNAEGEHVRTHNVTDVKEAAELAHNLAGAKEGHSAKIVHNGVTISTIKHENSIPHHFINM